MIITQRLEHSHFAPDNSPVASRRAHPALKRANCAEIERYNGQLLIAANTGNVEDMRRLLGAGADIESKDNSGETPLSRAAENGHLNVVQFLVNEASADVESKDVYQRIPLSYAAEYGHLEVAEFLVNEADPKADVESKSDSRRTPLSYAASNGELKVVKFLINETGADITSKNEEGKTALDVARREAQESWRKEGCEAVAAWLEEEEESRSTNCRSRANVKERR